MKIYRIHIHDGGESKGYKYCSSQREVSKFKAEVRQTEEEAECDVEEEAEFDVEEIEVEISKQGILRALNRWGSHADNG